jgi:hypothetical protein
MFWRYKEVIRIRNSMKNRQHNVLSVLLKYTDYDYSFGIFKTLRCLFFFDIRILITPLVSSDIMLIDNKMSWRYKGVIRIRISKKNRQHNVWRYQRGNQNPYIKEEQTSQCFEDTKTLYCLLFFDIRILITPLVSSRHYIVCSSLICGFWLPLWYLQDIVLSVLRNQNS